MQDIPSRSKLVPQWTWRHAPTLEQYLDNACVPISAHVTLMHCNFLISNTSSKEILEWLERADDDIEYCASLMTRGHFRQLILYASFFYIHIEMMLYILNWIVIRYFVL